MVVMPQQTKALLLTGRYRSVLGMRVDEADYERVLVQIRYWVHEGISRYVCVSTVHMAMECYDDSAFKAVVNGADLVVPDGMPLVWVSRLLGLHNTQRVFGPFLTTKLCEMAARCGIPVGFYGSTPEIIAALTRNMTTAYPNLQVVYSHSPPFRPLSREEDEAVVQAIKMSGAQILLVGLGCPKQEHWMVEHRDRLSAILFGVGWGFEVGAGMSKTAPPWMQAIGLEWLYRLLHDPRKVWKRQLKHNPRFILLIIMQLLGLVQYPVVPRTRGMG